MVLKALTYLKVMIYIPCMIVYPWKLSKMFLVIENLFLIAHWLLGIRVVQNESKVLAGVCSHGQLEVRLLRDREKKVLKLFSTPSFAYERAGKSGRKIGEKK